ncbi:MAG TPA: hypothetical protein VLH94_00760 [Spirochaetia bacterium]|nr:hypothetical protein [Spirochaetia bacterium]
MDEIKLKNLIRSEIENYNNRKQFSLSKIPSHKHDGADSPKVSTKDLVYSINQSFLIVAYATNPAATNREQFTFSFPGAKKVEFYGIVGNNANGTSTPPASTKKAVVTGVAHFGTAENLTGYFPTPITTPDQDSIVQGCNYMYIDEFSLANTAAGSSTLYLAYAFDESQTLLASASVVGFTDQGVTIEFYQSIGYYLAGTFFIT